MTDHIFLDPRCPRCATLVLSAKDWEVFQRALQNPPTPNAALKALMTKQR